MQNDITASFIPMWDKDGLTVQVTVEDAVKMIMMQLLFMWILQIPEKMTSHQ